MNVYIINFTTAPDRKDLTSAFERAQQKAEHGIIRDRIRKFIDDNDLAGEVEHLGKPTFFPVLPITCTPEAAQKLAGANIEGVKLIEGNDGSGQPGLISRPVKRKPVL